MQKTSTHAKVEGIDDIKDMSDGLVVVRGHSRCANVHDTGHKGLQGDEVVLVGRLDVFRHLADDADGVDSDDHAFGVG